MLSQNRLLKLIIGYVLIQDNRPCADSRQKAPSQKQNLFPIVLSMSKHTLPSLVQYLGFTLIVPVLSVHSLVFKQ